jgi:pimeloyl-ACP methyl ester carboxylesterase
MPSGKKWKILMSLSRNVALAAATTGIAALANHLADRSAESAHPPLGRVVDVDDVRLHVLEEGEGPPVLYLHGNGGMIQEVQATGLVELISRDHRLIVVDRPGFGHSSRPRARSWTPEEQADLISKLLSKLGASPAIIIGHSWGAMVATAMAIHHGAHVRGLVLVGGYFYPTERLDSILSSFAATPVVGDVIRHTVGPLFGRISAPAAISHVFAPDAVTIRFEEMYPVSLAVRSSQLRAVSEETTEMAAAAARLCTKYKQIHCPVEILAGSADAMVDVGQSTRLARELSSAHLEIFEQRGHMLPHIMPLAVVAAMARVEAAGGAVHLPMAEEYTARLEPTA